MYEITYSVTDDCGRTSTCIQSWTIANDLPTITCPADVIVACFDEAVIGDEVVTTSCTLGFTVEIIEPAGPITNCNGAVYTSTYVVVDDCGREASCEFNITIENTPPTLTCPIVTISCEEVDNFIPQALAYAGPCGQSGSIDGVVTTPYDGCATGTMIVTYAGTDVCGVVLDTDCVVDVIGAGPATITCPDVTISCVEADFFTPPAATFAGSCGSAGTIAGIVSVPYEGCADGTLTTLYDGTDDCGNPITMECTVTVTAAGPPLMACEGLPAPILCDEVPNFQIPPVTYIGDCGNSGQIQGVVTIPYSGCGDGIIIALYELTDDCGNDLSIECTFPVQGAPPAEIACDDLEITCVEAETFVPADIPFSTECGGSGTLVGQISAAYMPCGDGAITVLYEGEDDCGNSYLSLIHI